MADRFPLIVDSSAEQIQELSAGDNLDLTGSNLINANNIQTSNMNVVGVMTATKFKGDGSELDNLPAGGSSLEATASGTLADGSKVIVNADGTVSAVAYTGTPYWIATLGSTGEIDQGRGIAVDGSGNIYVTGKARAAGAGAGSFLIAKYNSAGVVQWQRTLSGSSVDEAFAIAVDSSGNAYIGGSSYSYSGSSGRDFAVAKYNTSGVIQWQRVLVTSGSESDCKSVAVDSSGNLYAIGYPMISAKCIIAKYNTSGVLQWQRTLDGTGNDYGFGIAVDGSSNVYISGITSSGSGGTDFLIAKYNSSGTIQWQRSLGGTNYEYGRRAAVDSSGNIYVCGKWRTSGGDDNALIAKYNTSGALQWQRSLQESAGNDQFNGIAVDSSGRAYVIGYTYSYTAGSNDILIARYTTSGALNWQRILGGTGNDFCDEAGIAVDSSGSIYFIGETTSSGPGTVNIIFGKLPDDGSLTGTYGSITYAAANLNESTTSFTDASTSLTDSASSLTDVSTSFTDSASNLTLAYDLAPSSNLTAENYIGISDGTYTNGQTATVQLIGSVDDAQSSLTPGKKYYVQNDGTLSTTAGSPSVLAGTAVAATKLVIKK